MRRGANTPSSSSLGPSTPNTFCQLKLMSTVINSDHPGFTSSHIFPEWRDYNELEPSDSSTLIQTSFCLLKEAQKTQKVPSQDPSVITQSRLWNEIQNLYRWPVPTLACQLHIPMHFLAESSSTDSLITNPHSTAHLCLWLGSGWFPWGIHFATCSDRCVFKVRFKCLLLHEAFHCSFI